MLKKNILCIAALYCSFMFLSGCCTTRADASGTILDYQQQVNRLEEELRNRDRAIDSAIQELGAITNRSSAVEGTIDEIIELFTEYQRRVDKLLYDYNRVRTEVENKDEDYISTANYIDYQNCMYDYRVCSLFKEY